MEFLDIRNEKGVSLIEILMVVLVSFILIAIGTAVDFKPLQNPLLTETSNIASFLKHARAKAVSTTSAILVTPESHTRLRAVRGISCSDINPEETSYRHIELAPDVIIADLEWSTCFTSRGLATENVQIPVHHKSNFKTIEVMLGGGVRIL
jgi:hypothetical protein